MTDPTPPKQPAFLLVGRFVMEVGAWGGLFWWGWSIADGGLAGELLGGIFL